MKKILLFAGAIAMSAVTMAQQTVRPKWDFTLQRMMKGTLPTEIPATRGAGSGMTSVSIETTDAGQVVTFIQNAGFKATRITDSVLTAVIPVNFVEQVAALDVVVRLKGPVMMQPSVDKALEVTGVDNIHSNALEEFETPFTGKGVIIGVIDQGFQYRHAAFLDADKKSRVIALWNRENYPRDEQPTTDIPDSGQADNAGGHGTHVTCIAAGSKVNAYGYDKEKDVYEFRGVAYDADIIMIPSTFNDNEVLEDVKYIKDVAKAEGKPYVVNMSFGGQYGSHDGTSLYNRTLNELISDNSGVFVVAASNDGEDKLHASHTFTEDDEVRYVFLDPESSTISVHLLSIWEQTADGEEYIEVEPCFFKASTKKVTVYTEDDDDYSSTELDWGFDEYSNKFGVDVYCDHEKLIKKFGKDIYPGVKITGKKGACVHVWNNSNWDEIYTPASVSPVGGVKKEQFLVGDNAYLVSEGATAEKAITVASYNTGRYDWTTLNDGKRIGYKASDYEQGVISDFSSRGPSLTENVIHPTITGPGAVIISALNSYTSGFNKNDVDVVAAAKLGNNPKQYYYGPKQGTSMSTPFVTGVIALWYQANPNLTHEQIMTIIKETAINDEFTAQEGQNAWGYGKINPYEGLKRALKLASTDGINDMQNSEAPVSFHKGNNAWRILFNTNESSASIRVTDLNGRLVAQQTLEQPKRGEETVVSLESLPAGVYLINVTTTKANITRKVVKK